MKILAKLCSVICSFVAFVLLFLIIGTAGAIELNDVTIAIGAKQMMVEGLMFVAAVILSYIFTRFYEEV